MKIRKTDDIPLPLWLEMVHPEWDRIQYHEKACHVARIPYQVLWESTTPCLVCTWEYFSVPLSDFGQQRLMARARPHIEKRRNKLREQFPNVGLSFSVCRWQCSFENLPDMDTGRELATELSLFLSELLQEILLEDEAD